MSGFVYHGALAPLQEACNRVAADVSFISSLLDSGRVKNPVLRKMVILMHHLAFAFSVNRTGGQRIFFIRDFSNLPLMLVFPLLLRKKSRLFFLVNHNLQWTTGSRSERFAFYWLGKQGCRFVFFEQVPDCASFASSDHVLHPVPDTQRKRESGRGLRTIGIVGQYRPEKGIDDLLAQLEPLSTDYCIVLGLPNRTVFKRYSRFSDAAWLTCKNTTEFDVYQNTIAECDVIVLNHAPSGYEYRASGLIADAAAAHVPVIVRNLPVLSSQIHDPICVGEVFEELSELRACIDRVSVKLEKGGYDFAAYKEARSGEALSVRLMEIFKA